LYFVTFEIGKAFLIISFARFILPSYFPFKLKITEEGRCMTKMIMMKIDLYWDDDDQTMLLCEFQAGWTWDDLMAVLRTVKRLSDERQQVFGALIDLRHGMTLPGGSILNAEGLKQFQQIMQLGADGKGPVAVIGAGTMIRMVMDAIRRVNPSALEDVVFTNTLEEARRLLYPRVQSAST
jgi:hypothetical protein